MKGTLTYWARESRDIVKSLKLTVCSTGDLEAIQAMGLAETRRMRITRLLDEARKQGVHLTYRDLSLILLTSKATLKRDMREIRKKISGSDDVIPSDSGLEELLAV